MIRLLENLRYKDEDKIIKELFGIFIIATKKTYILVDLFVSIVII